jgi:hypothetical protein
LEEFKLPEKPIFLSSAPNELFEFNQSQRLLLNPRKDLPIKRDFIKY